MTTPPAARTATFLMTDIEGSTRLWEEHRAAMASALEAHDTMLRSAVEGAGGTVVKTTGDGLLAAFDRPEAALAAAVDGQLRLDGQAWPETGPLHVRMAIHSGSAEVRDGDFFGPALNRVARLMSIGHGGQVLASTATAALVADGLPPGCELLDLGEHRLRDLDRAERVYQLAATGLRRAFPPLRATARRTTNLPLQVTSFVGRERQLADVARLLAEGRLVTLVGVGGTGKTRLMLQAAADLTDRHADGAWLVDLAPVTDPGLVVGEVGRALGVQQQQGQAPVDTVADFLRMKDLLLLLDNCEHLIGAAADVAHHLLARCPGLRVLATSREPLGVEGEDVVAVPSLALPAAIGTAGGPDAAGTAGAAVDDEQLAAAARSEAIRLFVDRATATLPSFVLDRSNAGAVVEICRRLDGIPLALELAAARVNVLSVGDIAQGLGDRFRLLTGGRRTAAPRQQTLQAAIDWSWDLLTEADRTLLGRLSVFAGGWTLDAAVAVTRDSSDAPDATARLETLDGLSRLVDRSLVVVDRDGSTRYRMLETIRQYAGGRLAASGETAALRDRHLALFRRLAVEADVDGREMVAWLERLDAEVDNLRGALEWAFETDAEAALRMCVWMSAYWRSRLIGSEGIDRMFAAVELARRWRTAGASSPDASSPAGGRSGLAAMVIARATLVQASYTGRRADATLESEAIALARDAGDPAAVADTLVTLAFSRVAVDGSLPSEGPDGVAALEALALAEGRGDWYHVSIIEAAFAIHEAAMDPATAGGWLDRATEAGRRSGNPFVIGNVVAIRGRVASRAGRLAEAERWFLEARAQIAPLGDRRFVRVIESELAHALRRDGRLDEAEAEYRRTIRGWQMSGNDGAVANQLECIGFLAVARSDGPRAARLLGAAEALRETAGSPMTPFEHEEHDAAMGRLRGAWDAGALAEAWAEGRRMTADAAVAFALSA